MRRLSDSPERKRHSALILAYAVAVSNNTPGGFTAAKQKCGTRPINETRSSEVIADVPWGYRRRARLSLNTYRKHSNFRWAFAKRAPVTCRR